MTEIPGTPDWPVVRHLTWREAHLFEVGLWPGLGIAFALHYGEAAMVLALFSAVRRRMQADDQRENSEDKLRGYVQDAWYMAAGAVFGLGLGALLVFGLTQS